MSLRTSIWLLSGLAAVAVLVLGCDPPPTGPTLNEANNVTKPKVREALPVPTTVADVEKLGLPVLAGSELKAGDGSNTLEEEKDRRVYKVTLIAPATVSNTAEVYAKGLTDSTQTGATDTTKVTGKTKDGDKVEVLLGPAADHNKTLVMAWVSQRK